MFLRIVRFVRRSKRISDVRFRNSNGCECVGGDREAGCPLERSFSLAIVGCNECSSFSLSRPVIALEDLGFFISVLSFRLQRLLEIVFFLTTCYDQYISGHTSESDHLR